MASLIAASTSICVVTSSAVVGSSNTIRSGSEHSAIAVITRCSWPPDTWCGKRLPMFSGSGRLSFLNSATARFSASARVATPCFSEASTTWSISRCAGLKAAAADCAT